MKIKKFFGQEQRMYYEKLDNGFEIYLLPNKHHKSYHIDLVTKYGSDIDEFVPLHEKQSLKLPFGVAHFLEHKMFDMKDEDIFAFYAKSGTFINAGTNYIATRYYLDGKKNYQKNLNKWLSMVFTPYFSEEKITKEKGIIQEEIKMYDDEPAWILDYATRKCLYHSIFQEKISGTTESIQKINADILEKTYRTFYQPSNMFIVITGNIPIKKTIDIIKNNEALKKRESNHKIIYEKKKEVKEVVREYACLKEKIIIPKLNYSFKFDLNDFSFSNKSHLRIYLNMVFSYLFGEASSFSEEIIEKELATDFYINHTSFDNIYTFSIDAESEYADIFKEKVDNCFLNISLTEEDFLRVKKVFLSLAIRSLDNINALSNSVVEMVLREEEDFDFQQEMEFLHYQDMLKIISEMDFSHHSFVLMLPKE